jgi:hypothetical protein
MSRPFHSSALTRMQTHLSILPVYIYQAAGGDRLLLDGLGPQLSHESIGTSQSYISLRNRHWNRRGNASGTGYGRIQLTDK